MDHKKIAEVLSTISAEQWDAIATLSPIQRESIYHMTSAQRETISMLTSTEWKKVIDNNGDWDIINIHINEDVQLYTKIRNILDEIRIDPKLAGYNYLVETLFLICKSTANKINLMNKIYPIVAKRYGNTDPHNIDRDIRYAISDAYKNSDSKILYKYLKRYPKDGRPSNKKAIEALIKHIHHC